MRKILLLAVIFLLPQGAFAAVSQDSFYSTGSDFLVIQNPSSNAYFAPEFYAAFDNTKLFFDINNDGAYDYEYTIDRGGPHKFNFPWSISEGTKVHADKPVHCIQSFYANYRSSGPAWDAMYYETNKYTTVPPVQSFRNEYYIRKGYWNIIATGEQTVFVDEKIDGTNEQALALIRNSTRIYSNDFAMLYSDKPFIAYSSEGLAGALGKDFYSTENKFSVISGTESALISIDTNNDGKTDYSGLIGKGVYYFPSIPGSRLSSSEDVAVFSYNNGTGITYDEPHTYFPALKADSVSDEFSIYGQQSGHYLYGLFNSDSAPDAQDFKAKLYLENPHETETFENLTTGLKYSLPANYSTGKADVPVFDSYNHIYRKSPYLRYFLGHTMAYHSVYLTTTPKSKYVLPSDSAIISVQVVNPYKSVNLSSVAVKFPINNEFSMPAAIINGKKENLLTGEVSAFSDAVTLYDDGLEKYFVYEYGGVLESESSLEIYFELLTPQNTSTYSFGDATLTYRAPTWVI